MVCILWGDQHVSDVESRYLAACLRRSFGGVKPKTLSLLRGERVHPDLGHLEPSLTDDCLLNYLAIFCLYLVCLEMDYTRLGLLTNVPDIE